MKHNQFKHIVNTIIKDKCNEHGFTMAGVDITNNQKYIYIYDDKWNCVISIRLWVNDTGISITASKDTTKVAGLCNRPFECECNYLEFNKAYQLLDSVFSN